MNKVQLLLAFLCCWLGPAAPAVAQDCTQAELVLWDKRFSSWEASHEYFKRYRGRCSDGVLAEALSSIHTGLLIKDRRGIEKLARLAAQDPDYLNWVLLGVFYNPEEVKVNSSNTACRLLIQLRSCPSKHRSLCGKLAARVGPSPEYVAACPAR